MTTDAKQSFSGNHVKVMKTFIAFSFAVYQSRRGLLCRTTHVNACNAVNKPKDYAPQLNYNTRAKPCVDILISWHII